MENIDKLASLLTGLTKLGLLEWQTEGVDFFVTDIGKFHIKLQPSFAFLPKGFQDKNPTGSKISELEIITDGKSEKYAEKVHWEDIGTEHDAYYAPRSIRDDPILNLYLAISISVEQKYGSDLQKELALEIIKQILK